MVRVTRWKARGCRFDSPLRHIFSFWIFRLLPVADGSAKPIQMKSSMAFIQSNECTERDLILKNYGAGLYNDGSVWCNLRFDDMLLERNIHHTLATYVMQNCMNRWGFIPYLTIGTQDTQLSLNIPLISLPSTKIVPIFISCCINIIMIDVYHMKFS